MKKHLATLWGNDEKPLWETEAQRDAVRAQLNEQGFYVLTGTGDTLEVYSLEYSEPLDIKIAKKSLEKFQKVWYKMSRRIKEANQ